MEILDAARTPVKSADLVFPMRSGKPISASRLLKALREYGIAVVMLSLIHI